MSVILIPFSDNIHRFYSGDYHLSVPSPFHLKSQNAYVHLATEAGYGRHLWDYPISTFNKSYFQVTSIPL